VKLKLGDRHEIDGTEYEVTGIGKLDEEGNYEVVDGRIPLDGDTGLLITPDDEPGDSFWLEPVSLMRQRERIGALEFAMDSITQPVRVELLGYEVQGAVPFGVVVGLVRAAAAYGYVYGTTEEPRGQLAEQTGYRPDGMVPDERPDAD
jgi:hypothetical protein